MVDIVESFGGLDIGDYVNIDNFEGAILQSLGDVCEEAGGTHGEEKITDIMCDKHPQAHIREMEAVTQEDQRQGHDVMADKLLEILARLLHAQQKHDSLLRPVRGLEEVVELEGGVVGAVREGLVHGARIEVPQRRAAHHVQPTRPRDAKVDGRVHLLHEARLLGAGLDAAGPGQRAQELLHDEFAREGEHDDVEGHESDVPPALAILDGRVGRGGVAGQGVREEEKAMHGISGHRVDGVEREDDGEEDERDDPGVFEGVALGLPQNRARLVPFRRGLLAVSRLLCLWKRGLAPFSALLTFAAGRGISLSPTIRVHVYMATDTEHPIVPTLIDRGDGITSMVARAGALVSPALISPPRPLDRLRDGLPLPVVLGVLKRLPAVGVVDGERGGKASVAGIVPI